MKILHVEDENNFKCETINLTDDTRHPLHWHGNIEIIYVEKGSIRLGIRKKSYDVKAGEFAYINSCDHHTYHKGYVTTDVRIRVYSFSTVFVSNISKLRFNISYIASNDDIDRLGIREQLEGAIIGIEKEKTSGEYTDALVGAYITQLVLNLQKTYIPKEDLGTVMNVEYEHLFSDFRYNYENSNIGEKTMGKFQMILDYLDKNFNDTGISLTTLSEISTLSECYISELFTLIVGIKFKQYLNTLRINYALRLLSMSDITISQAAYESGFDTIRTFNSAFKRLKGVTPSEYLSGVNGKNSDTGIVTSFVNLRADSCGIRYFPGSCDIKVTTDPTGERGNVFGIFANCQNKVWTTFNVSMIFKAGSKYRISFDVFFLDDVNGKICINNVVGINLFYSDSGDEAVSHNGGAAFGSTGDGWIHIEKEMHISDNYVPCLYDKFSIYGNPANDVGVNYLLDNITCVECE